MTTTWKALPLALKFSSYRTISVNKPNFYTDSSSRKLKKAVQNIVSQVSQVCLSFHFSLIELSVSFRKNNAFDHSVFFLSESYWANKDDAVVGAPI